VPGAEYNSERTESRGQRSGKRVGVDLVDVLQVHIISGNRSLISDLCSLTSEHFKMGLKTWIKRIGFWGLVFFLLKGLLWLTIPLLIAIFADETRGQRSEARGRRSEVRGQKSEVRVRRSEILVRADLEGRETSCVSKFS
jgi:hypothetical protein